MLECFKLIYVYYNVKQELITNSHILRSSDLDMKFNMKNLCIEPRIVFLHTFHLTLNGLRVQWDLI